ncbi:MAG TPA: hypothetical protein VHN36_11245 [Ilumatobacteraceae bacterium]|nr:hypothetical protein [Ilumatobacteraceae bacterium]
MDLLTVLAPADEILDEASAALERANLRHYSTIDAEERRARLVPLLELVTTSVRSRDLIPVIDYAKQVATDRFHAGYDISEIQCALNVLEETIWIRLVDNVSSSDIVEAVGLLSTVVGAGKDALARTYVSLASKQHVPSLDLSALFQGGDR